MATKRVVLNDQTLIDLTMDTVAPEFVVQGKTFHGRDGEIYSGTYKPNIQALVITENGIYPIDELVDGYGPITVEVTSGSIDPSMRPTLVPPSISVANDTSTLTITDSYNDQHTEEYDIYLNGTYALTVHQHIVKLAHYFELLDTTQIAVTAKSASFNTSERSNTVLWKVHTPSTSTSTSGILYTPNAPYVNGAKKLVAFSSDSNSSSYTGGYRVYCNDVEILDIPFANRSQMYDISEFVDYSIEQYFSIQAYIKTGQTSYTKDSLISSKRKLIVPADEGSENYLAFTLTNSTPNDSYYTCSGFSSSYSAEELPTEITIPNYFNGWPVRYVSGFSGKPITKVITQEGMLGISSSAFSSCTSLTQIEFADTITTINANAFYNCTALTSVTFPKSLTSLRECCFQSCTKLNRVDFGECKNSVTVYYYAFQNCPQLTALYMNEASLSSSSNSSYTSYWYGNVTSLYFTSVKAICRCNYSPYWTGPSDMNSYYYNHPFCGRTNGKIYLNNVEISALDLPDDITSIGVGCFYKCSNINSINLNKVTSISNIAFAYSSVQAVFTSENLTTIGVSAFANATSLRTFDFKVGLLTINDYGFYNCNQLVFYSLPSSLKTIGPSVFYNNSSLTEVVLPSSVSSLGDSAFYGCSKLNNIKLPVLITACPNYVFQNCTSLQSVSLSWRTASIGSSSFMACSKLETINLPNTINYIYSNAFSDCVALQIESFPNQLLEIGSKAFYNCKSITKIEVHNGVHTIGSQAFYGCTNLIEIFIGRSVQTFSNDALQECKSLQIITVHPENPAFYAKDNILYNKTSKTIVQCAQNMEAEVIVLDEEFSSIAAYAFQYSKIKVVVAQQGLKTIGNYAFQYSQIENITFPSSLTSIGQYCFSNCGKLKQIDLPTGLTSLGGYCFNNASSLEYIYFGESIKTIPTYCCYQCVALKNFSLPITTTTIGSYAFYNCYATEDVTLPQSIVTIEQYAFYKVNFKEITLPNATTNQYCFQYCTFETLDLKALTKNIATYSFYYATIDTLYFAESKITVNGQAFYGATINKLYLMNEQPKGTYYSSTNTVSYYSWGECRIEDLYIYNLESWCVYDSYNLGLYGAKKKHVLNRANEELTSASFTFSSTSWTNSQTNNFINLKELYLEATSVTLPSQCFYGNKALEYVYINSSLSSGYNQSSGTDHAFYQAGTAGKPLVVEIGPKATGIPGYFFNSYSNCTELKFAEESKCTTLYSYAFYTSKLLTKVTLPESLISIGSYAFYQCSTLRELYIPSSVKTIYDYAFQYCYCLSELDLTNVTTLGAYACQYCYGLHSVKLPSTLKTVPSYCFDYCRSLKEIDLTGYTTINDYAFRDCDSLHELIIPDTITTIGRYAFSSCSALRYVQLGENVSSINSYAFQSCENLFEIYNLSALSLSKGSSGYGYITYYAKNIRTKEEDPTIYLLDNGFIFYLDTSSNKYYLMGHESNEIVDLILPTDYQGQTYYLRSCAFSGMHSLKNITIPSTITAISSYCFSGCSGLEEITIPSHITSIGTGAFGYSVNLRRIYYNAIAATSSSTTGQVFAYAGYNNNSLECYVSADVTKLPTLFYGGVNSTPSSDSSIKLAKLVFSNISNCKTIDTNCFSGVSYATKVHIDSLKDWLNVSFSSSTSNPLIASGAKLFINSEETWLEDLIIPSENTTIKNYAFYGYDFLKSLTIGDHVGSIGASSFYANTALTELYIGEKVTSIGSQVFYGCTALKNIVYNAEEATSASVGFENIGSSAVVTIKGLVKRIPNSLFQSASIKELYIEHNENYLCFGTNSFSSSNVTKVRLDTFDNWFTFEFENEYANPIANNSTGLYVNETLYEICQIPLHIGTINPYAFFRYKFLTELIVHETVSSIGEQAFIGIPNLQEIILSNENTNLVLENGCLMPKDKNYICAVSVNYVGDIELPDNLLTIPAYTFYNRTNIINVVIPSTVTSIGDRAFYGCTSLQSVNLPEDLTTLNDYAFYNCIALKSLYYNCLNLGTMSGKSYCFYRIGYNNRNAEGLTVYIGSEVKKIADYLFNPAGNDDSYRAFITKIDGSNNNVCTTIGSYAFTSCTYLKEAILPSSITSIQSYAFYYDWRLTTFPYLPNLLNISNYAFYYTGFVTIEFPETLTTIGSYCFQSTTTLLDVYIPTSVTSIGYYAFQGCSQLKIYCEVSAKPPAWDGNWNPNGRPVVWSYEKIDYTYHFITNTEETIEDIISKVFIQLPTLTQENSYFWGWYKEEDFSGEQYFPNQFFHAQGFTDENNELTLYARWEEEPDGSGNSFADARRIGLNQKVSISFPASVGSSGSKYFIFTAKETKTYYVTTTSPTRTRGYIYTSSNSQITSSSNMTNSTLSFSATAGASYVVRFYPYSSSASAYTMSFSVG